MDVLSDVISVVRLGRPVARRVEWTAPWRQDFPELAGTAGFLVVLQGSCWWLDGPAGPGHETGEAAVAIGPGDVLFSPHGRAYSLADRPPGGGFAGHGGRTVTVCGGYRLDADRSHPLLRELPPTVHLPATLGRDRGLRTAVEILGAEADSGRPGAAALLPAALDLLLLYTLRLCLERPHDIGRSTVEPATGAGWAAALADPVVAVALDAVHADPAHPWTVQGLAERARSSRAAFARRFTALVGRPPLAYVTWWRMVLAHQMLSDPAVRQVDVARRVGYRSEFAFATAFRRETGRTPGEVRRGPRASPPVVGPSPSPSDPP